MLVCEIPIITMNFSSAGVWAHLPNLPQSNWKGSLRTKRRPTKEQERFTSKWMVRSTLIQIMPVQYQILISTQSTTNLNMSVLIRWSGCWMPIRFINQKMTMFPATTIEFQACPERSFWHIRLGPYCWLWEDGFRIWYARSAGGRWNGSWQDFHLGGSSNVMQIAYWESCNRVTAIELVAEYPWRVGWSGKERHSRDYRWWTEVVSIAETEFNAPPPFRDPVNSAAGACSCYISFWTDPGADNAQSCRDI